MKQLEFNITKWIGRFFIFPTLSISWEENNHKTLSIDWLRWSLEAVIDISEWDEDHALDQVLNGMIEDLDHKYVIQLKYNNGVTDLIEIVTDDFNKSISQIQRNRDFFTYEIISKEVML